MSSYVLLSYRSVIEETMKTQAEFEAANRRWASQLRGRSLVIEADAVPDEARLALEIIGRTYRFQNERQQKAALLRRFRAAYLVGLCSVAAFYDVAGLWPYLERYFGPLNQNDHHTLSDEFRDGLDAFGLARFQFPRRNIDEMLMHAGIPGPRTDEFMELLARRSALTDGLNGRQFCQWVGALTPTGALAHGLDVPTWRFLREGRELSEDMVDRALELLDRFAAGTVSSADLAAFPAVMHADLLRALDELGEKQLRVRRRHRDQVDLVPRLVFSLVQGLQVRLPSVEHVTESSVDWLFAAEGRTDRMRIDAPWPGDAVRSHFFPVTRPVKQLALTAQPGAQTWTLDILDPDDPMLAFDGSTGEWIPARNSLPRTDIWFAVPSATAEDASDLVEVQGDWSPEWLEAPLGWHGWTFARVSLASVRGIRLRGRDRWRYVSSNARPQIETGPSVAFLRTGDGARVYSALPQVRLPATPQSDGAASTVDWTVSIARTDGTPVASRTVTVGHTERQVDVPVPDDFHPVSEFDVRIRGPLGRGTTRRVAVVEGLTASSTVAFRRMLPSGAGLEPAEILIHAPFCEVTAITRTLGRDASSVSVELAAADTEFLVHVEVPAMRVAVLGDDRPRGSHSAVSIDLEDLPSSRLQVSLGTSGRTSLVAMKQGVVLQAVTATAAGPLGTAVFNLAQLVDTLGRSGGATLLISAEGERIRVAQVRRRQLIAGARLEGDVVVLDQLSSDEPLELALYRRYAPWLAPVIVRTEGGVDRFELPLELVGECEVRLVVDIDDAWTIRSWDRAYPHRGLNAVDVDLGDLTDARGGADGGFRSWLRRTSACPSRLESVQFAMELYANANLAKYRTPRRELQKELAQAISPFVDCIPATYSQSAVGEQPIDLFVEADAVSLPPGDYAHGDALWDASPLLGLLASSGHGFERPSTEQHVERLLGSTALQILTEGADPASAIGRFNSNTEILARMPRERLDEIWRSANPVPDHLLDETTRQIAAKQLFDGRDKMIFDYRAAEAELFAARRALEEAYGTPALLPIDARVAKPGWTNLPAYSISYCLVARAAARGHAAALLLHEVTRAKLLSISRMSPAFVEQDLVLAELWTTRWSTR